MAARVVLTFAVLVERCDHLEVAADRLSAGNVQLRAENEELRADKAAFKVENQELRGKIA